MSDGSKTADPFADMPDAEIGALARRTMRPKTKAYLIASGVLGFLLIAMMQNRQMTELHKEVVKAELVQVQILNALLIEQGSIARSGL